MTLYKSIKFGKQLHLMTICSFGKIKEQMLSVSKLKNEQTFSSALYSPREGLLQVSELWENGLILLVSSVICH